MKMRTYGSITPLLVFVACSLFVFVGIVAEISDAATTSKTKTTSPDYIPQKQVHLSIGSQPNTLVVTWVTFKPVTRPVVRFNVFGQTHRREIVASTHTYTEGGWVGYIHDATLTSLIPGTTYFYQVGDEGSESWSEVMKFHAPTSKQADQIMFAAFGDTGVFNTSKSLYRKLNEIKESLDFVVHVGDFGYNKEKGKWGIQYEEYALQKQHTWDEWFDTIEPISSEIPYMVCPGNHETGRFDFNYIPYSNRFNMPGENDFWYSFDYGPIHFVSLSTDHEFHPLSDQLQWLNNDLASVKRQDDTWIIVYLHRPMYSSSPEDGSNLPLRAAIEHILVKHKVDITFCGHDHSYERTFPVNAGIPDSGALSSSARFVNPGLPVHVRVGTGGIDLTAEFDPWPSWSAYRNGQHHGFVLVNLNTKRNTLRVEFISTDDNTIKDVFEIVKGSAQSSSLSLVLLIAVPVLVVGLLLVNQKRKRSIFRPN